jgi:L-2-hydroxycarboxylate dehydrogenase (NAD+)
VTDTATTTGTTRRLSVAEATDLAVRSLRRLGYTDGEAAAIADHLVDAALRGIEFAGLPRILAVAEKMRLRPQRLPIEVVHETPVSAMLDAGNNVGYLAVLRGTEIAREKAAASGIAVVGIHNSYYSGRSGYYVERLVDAGLVAIHICSAERTVVPYGGTTPSLGTNPIAFGFPSDDVPVVFDMGTSAIMHGEVQLRARTGTPLPDGVAVDATGEPTLDAAAALLGGFLPFGGHKGYGLSLAAQLFGVLSGAARTHGELADYAFFLLAMRPDLLMPAEEFTAGVAALVAEIKAGRSTGGEIMVPGERGRAQAARNRTAGIVVEDAVYAALEAL